MHTPILAYTFIGFCILLSLEDPPFFGRYMGGFLIQRPLEATVLTASLTHGAATAPEEKAQLEALLFFLGQCRAIGDMVARLAILNLGSVSETDPFSPGDCM